MMAGLAARLGLGDQWPTDLYALWDDMLSPLGTTFGELSTSDKNWLNDDNGYHHENLDSDGLPVGFGTPSRKVELRSSIFEQLGLDPLPTFTPPRPVADGPGGFPYRLMTGATRLTASHSDHRHVETLRSKYTTPRVKVHPDTASAEGMSDGEWIWIETEVGRIVQRLVTTTSIAPGTVDVERWIEPRSTDLRNHANVLIDARPGDCDPVYGTWPLRVGWCRIGKLSPQADPTTEGER